MGQQLRIVSIARRPFRVISKRIFGRLAFVLAGKRFTRKVNFIDSDVNDDGVDQHGLRALATNLVRRMTRANVA